MGKLIITIMMKNRRICFAAMVLMLVASGCAKNEIYIKVPGSDTDSGSGSSDASLVTFHASVESTNLVRSLSPMRKNVETNVFAFNGTAPDAAGTPVAQGLYLTSNPGVMIGQNGYRMQLVSGVYNFYAVSANITLRPPKFSNGVSEPLFNGFDYLWWNALQQDVASEQTSIPVVFLHSATQVTFDVSAGTGVTIDQLALAHLKASVDGASMDLTTGTIPPATSFQTNISKMGIRGNYTQYTMLPVKTDDPLWVSFDIIINGESTARTFEVEVPLPDGELKAGNSYLFSAVIQANNTVEFPTVDVTNWVDVDETGKPLYPKP